MTDNEKTAQLRLEAVVASVAPTDPAAEERAWARLDQLTKPPRSLGRVEEIAARVARIQCTDHPSVSRKAVVVAAADHGVVAEGISQFPQDVTWQMVANFVAGGAAINQFARSVGADVVIYDVGVVRDVSLFPGVVHRKIAPGTANMAQGPAMTREQCAEAIMVGVEAATGLVDAGYNLIGTGEMGIGNTTAASALTAAFAGTEIAAVVGRGTGLDDAGVRHKIGVVERALSVNAVDELDALGKFAAVGGLEIAALAGVMIGAAARRTCVVIDGFISSSAALAAVALCPACSDYLVPSHLSVEPGHAAVLGTLGVKPLFDLDMRLGEGTGAVLAFALIDAACEMLSGMATFAEAGVSGSEG